MSTRLILSAVAGLLAAHTLCAQQDAGKSPYHGVILSERSESKDLHPPPLRARY